MSAAGAAMTFIGCFFCIAAAAQTAGSAWPATDVPETDHRGLPIHAKPVPEDFDADTHVLERPESIFFDKDGLRFDPEAEKAGQRALSSEQEPRVLDAPRLEPRLDEEPVGFFRRLWDRVRRSQP